mmetsp:Transcript_4307/g.9550  ORF Transcript_4307/g.9550 Transcript_4307/m.9550 type:complete len:406 (-) Transcript_4307:980-2197(-)
MSSITVEKAFDLIKLIGREIYRDLEEEEVRGLDHGFSDKGFEAKCDRTVLGYMKSDPDINDDKWLKITSHDIKKFFQKRRINPRVEYSKFYSDKPPRAALTYEWSTTFLKIKAFLNPENIDEHNTSQAVITDSQSSRVFSGSCVTDGDVFTHTDFAPLRMMLGVLRFFSYYMFCCFGCCGLLASLPQEMSEFPIWIDIFFIDQLESDPFHDLDETEEMVKESATHLVIGTEGILDRAWCIYELLMRKEAGMFSQIIRAYGEEGDYIPQIQPVEGPALREYLDRLKDRNFFDEMKASRSDDKIRIQERLLKAFGSPQLVNDAVIRVVEGQEGFIPAGGSLRVLQGVVISILAWIAFPLALLLVLITLVVWALSALGKLVRVSVGWCTKPKGNGDPAQPDSYNKRVV